MIIKSMSRKAPTFGQLADYIARGATSSEGFVRNLYCSGHDQGEVVGQFLDNYSHLPERKGGNALYHEVIVLEPQEHLALEQVETALHDLAERYCERRAPHQLAWGRVHHDTEFPHIHLMISSNAARSDRRVRMDRKYFATVQRDLERWREDNLPELRCRQVYRRESPSNRPRVTNGEGELIQRTGTPSRKQVVFDTVHPIFEQAASLDQLEAKLRTTDFDLYRRGQTWGLVRRSDGQRFRLKTLGLVGELERLLRRERDSTPKGREDGRKPAQQETPPREVDSRRQALLERRMRAAARLEIDGFDRE